MVQREGCEKSAKLIKDWDGIWFNSILSRGNGNMNLLQEGVIFEKVKKGELSTSFIYHTCRALTNKQGQETGQIRVLTLKDNIARTEYICPECGHHGYIEQEWKRPFAVKCEKCGLRITVPKLKDQIKKKKD